MAQAAAKKRNETAEAANAKLPRELLFGTS